MSKKTKMTDGVLCRDKKSAGGCVVFFAGLGRKEVELSKGNGLWLPTISANHDGVSESTKKEWEEDYDLTPPRCGSAFEASVQL